MNKRNKIITTILLVLSMVMVNISPIFGEEIVETVEVQSINEETSVCSAEDNKWSEKYINGYSIVNDPGNFPEKTPAPYENVVLVSFTNTEEDLYAAAIDYKAETEKLYITNKGVITASNNTPTHWIMIQGFDGYGEEFYINRNLFDITDEELNNLELGEKQHGTKYDYYTPVSGLAIYDISYYGETDSRYNLIPSLEVVTDTYDYTGAGQEQTWIKITYTHPEQKKPLTKEEEIKAYKESFPNRIYYNDNDFIEVVSGNTFTGKKLKPIVSIGKTIINTVDGDDSKISEIYDSIYYSSDNKKQLKIKYKNNKNAGSASAIIKKCKEKPELKGKEITFEIEPVTVSDNNCKPKIKNGTVKSIKVLTGGKYKKVKKSMWTVVGSEIEFSGNYKGKCKSK